MAAGDDEANPKNVVKKSKSTKLGMDGENCETIPLQKQFQPAKWRNSIAYWLLGLSNNFGYVVMLSCAHDILSKLSGTDADSTDTGTDIITANNTTTANNMTRDCNKISTGAILLADILPSLIVKLIAPFLPFYVHVRVACAVVLSAGSFLLVALAETPGLVILGVILTSLSSGLGELTFLGYTSGFKWNAIPSWSSGTGAAGVFGAGSYAFLTTVGVTPRDCLLIMLIVPVVMGISFWLALEHPKTRPTDTNPAEEFGSNVPIQEEENSPEQTAYIDDSMKNNFKMIPSLLPYMCPLGAVYLFEYFINQGLLELVYFSGLAIDHSEQYRWMQLVYQIGVFISRSSSTWIVFTKIWVMAFLQMLNVALFTTEAIYFYIPHIAVVFILILWEGLLGGAAYVNTYHKISNEVPVQKRKFALSMTTVSDAIGIGLAGFIAIPVHNAICDIPL